MSILLERYSDVAAKDGGFIFQAIISHDIKWEIVNGETKIDPKWVNSFLHQIDVFPDIKFTEGHATSTYVILSEVNILKRKFELASEAIKKIINPNYASEITALHNEGLSNQKKFELNSKYFNNTYFEANLVTDKIVLREVSTSGLDTGSPKITLKVSTGMVNTLDGKPIQTWEKMKVKIDGSKSIIIPGVGENSISTIKEYDDIENINDLIFRTILPSLILEYKGDRVAIETYSNRSSQLGVSTSIDYNNLFNVEDVTKQKPNNIS
jgi:hypothetical protein